MEKIHYIKEIMLLKGVSLTELAKRLNVTKQAVSIQITHDLRVSKAKKIADALGVSLAALFVEPVQFTQSAPEEKISSSTICPKCGAELELIIKEK